MTTTSDLLAELEDLEFVPAPAPAPAPSPTREATIEVKHTPKPEPRADLDERGHKILALTDLVIQEFDRAVDALTTVKDAVSALREELSAPAGPALVEDDAPVTLEPTEALDSNYSAPDEVLPQGEPDSMDNVTITI
jgi:hypothetical protein